MIIYKLIQTSLDIQNSISLYTNLNNNLLNILINKFEKRCYSGCFILKIINIVRVSECVILQCNESGNGSIDIQFKALVMELMPNEIVVGAKVLKKDQERKMLIAVSDTYTLNVMTENIYDSVKEEQLIPVRIKKSLYTLGKDKIQAFAGPFIPSKNTIAYNLSGEVLSESDLPVFKDILSLIEDEVDKYNDLDKKEVLFFKDMTYAFKTKPNIKSFTSILNIVKLKELIGKPLNILTRLPHMDLAEPTAYMWDTEEILDLFISSIPTAKNVVNSSTSSTIQQSSDNTLMIKKVPLQEGIMALLLDYYSYLRMIREFCEVYKTKEMKESHVNLWRIFTNLK